MCLLFGSISAGADAEPQAGERVLHRPLFCAARPAAAPQRSVPAKLGLRRSLAQIWAHQRCVSNPAPAPPRAGPSPLAALPGSVVISQPSRRSGERGRSVCPARGGAEPADALAEPAGGERALSLRARGILAAPQADRLWPGVNIPLAWCPAQGGWRALAFNNLFIFPYCRNDDSFHY